MENIVENWYIIFEFLALIAVVIVAISRFAKLPTEAQIEKVKEWLLFAVTEAEKEFGSGTGQLKLRSVYDLFVQRFPWLVRAVSFELFSGWVDDALESMREMLAKNGAVKAIVDGTKEE